VWLRSVQNADGGWGETTDSYKNPALRGIGPSTASQTAWALIGLLETVQRLPALTGEFLPALDRGVDFLLAKQRADGNWDEPEFTGTGFPVHFYLNYHQYRLHFPLSALGRYAAWRRANGMR
jgi:squalene-hopene/tetraprenyl-beta-curcumene cyclase